MMKKFKTILPISILVVISFLTVISMDKIELSDNRYHLNEGNDVKQFYVHAFKIVNLSKEKDKH